MTSFRFPLQKILDWRRTQLDVEEVQYRQQAAAMAALDSASAQLQASGMAAERQVRNWKPVAGSELEALGSYRLHVQMKQTELAVPRAECRKELARRYDAMLEARRRLRLLERLRERRLSEWKLARDREIDEVAAESYLARWNQRQA